MKYNVLLQKLERMAFLNDYLNQHEFIYGDEADEYRSLLEELVPDLTDFLTYLQLAGLLTIFVPVELCQECIAEGYDNINADCDLVFENGSIWLRAGECAGGTFPTE